MAASGGRIVHLGLGAFHRAHQAVYLQGLHALGDRRWELASGNIRPDDANTIAALQHSGGAYTLETVSPDGQRQYERITAITRVFGWDEELRALVTAAAEPATKIISFTVTEAGYALRPDDDLAADTPEIAQDLATARAGGVGRTLYGVLAAVLARRMRAGAGPVTLLCCDNLRHNGERSRRALLQFLHAAGDAALAEWVRTNTTSPNAMVDRITPRPTQEVVARVHAATGVDDPAALMAETFLQWVIQDDFIAGRPAWERVGVQLVESVTPYEEAKIRLLNATHSCIAWAGTLLGYRYIHEGARDARVRELAYRYATDDAIAALTPSPLDLAAYRDTVLDRFGNAAILDTNQRVAMDSFAKIPAFLVPTVRDRLAAGRSVAATATVLALFLAFLQRWHRGALPFGHQDQAMDAAQAHALCEDPDPAAAFARIERLWGDLAGQPALVQALRQAYAGLPAALRP
ncbi:MAG TPA: D-arabinitol 4-dehydrogenase [Ramlibacter sp.]|jgi:D-arabinitol 4-dehydrogenase|nr:D-arabinitol 4-dehydrogenase [Ramlibacter sp.]